VLEVAVTHLSSLAATPEDHEAIRQVLQKMEIAHNNNSSAQYIKYSKQLHELMMRRCTNGQLLSILSNFEKYRKWIVSLHFKANYRSTRNLDEHKAIAERYMAKDLAGISEFLGQHIRRQRDEVFDILDVAGDGVGR
jgi:DNA-binding GntR family transcriptional regulator